TAMADSTPGCPELVVNSLKSKAATDAFPAKKVKRPKRAEANFYPSFPTGANLESLEKERLELLTDIRIRNNNRVIADKMAHTFAYRRQEVTEDIHLRRECVLRALIIFLGEDPDELIKEYL
ncbi:hypothetical protein JOQ06_009882, partial [Pogonophryne albipinna]